MIILAAALAVLHPFAFSSLPPWIGVGPGLNQGSGQQPQYVLAFTSLFEEISDSETTLQVARGDLLLARNKGAARKSLLNELTESSKAIRTYVSISFPLMAADPACSQMAPELGRKLEAYASDMDALRDLLASDSKQVGKSEVSTAWYRHGTNFRAVLVAALKVPHFNLAILKSPSAYNLAPVLYDTSESPIYADVSKPNRVIIGRTFGGKGAVLKEGDEILAFRDEDDKDWTPVKSWRDVLHTPKDSDAESKHHISLRIRRRQTTKEVTVGFVASMFYLD